MRVLLTGGSGFVGSALAAELVGAGHTVVAFDNNSRGSRERLAKFGDAIEFVEGDVRDFDAVRRATKGCDVIWHLAYVNGTRYFYERPDDVLEVGVKGTVNTIDAALEAGVQRYVLASTSETYNEPAKVPTDESEPLKIPDILNPRFSYGGGKIACELLTQHLARPRGLETVIFRPHNFYGPEMGYEHVIPEIVRRIVDLSKGLTKASVDLPIQGDGSQTRAFCFVTDGARGAFLAGEHGGSGEVYHIGTDRELPIRDLVTMIAAALGVDVTIVPGELPEGGTSRRCPDIAKVRSLGYEPQVSLEEGIAVTARWYAEHYGAHVTAGAGA